jgi:hypothetical protein
MSAHLSFLEIVLLLAAASLIAAAAAPQARARRASEDRAALEACRRTSESELRGIACAERLAALDAARSAAAKKH